MSANGKGDKPRPKTVDNKTWSKNYERIFGKKHGRTDIRPKRVVD